MKVLHSHKKNIWVGWKQCLGFFLNHLLAYALSHTGILLIFPSKLKEQTIRVCIISLRIFSLLQEMLTENVHLDSVEQFSLNSVLLNIKNILRTLFSTSCLRVSACSKPARGRWVSQTWSQYHLHMQGVHRTGFNNMAWSLNSHSSNRSPIKAATQNLWPAQSLLSVLYFCGISEFQMQKCKKMFKCILSYTDENVTQQFYLETIMCIGQLSSQGNIKKPQNAGMLKVILLVIRRNGFCWLPYNESFWQFLRITISSCQKTQIHQVRLATVNKITAYDIKMLCLLEVCKKNP